ncbi:MAG: cytochrome c [Bacteroidota bacterium]
MKKSKLLFTLLFVSIISIEATSKHSIQTGTWVAPESANALKNPLSGNSSATTEGKILYAKYCVVCHGATGKGDGVAAAALAIPPANHASAKVQSQSDGAIFWKITNGRGAMASYKTTFTDQQRWQLVNYIRTLAKAPK